VFVFVSFDENDPRHQEAAAHALGRAMVRLFGWDTAVATEIGLREQIAEDGVDAMCDGLTADERDYFASPANGDMSRRERRNARLLFGMLRGALRAYAAAEE
jgi:hypothetical protein